MATCSSLPGAGPEPRHRDYLGDGGQHRQPEALAGCARKADGSAQVAVVELTAAQHVQATGDGVATPVRDACKEHKLLLTVQSVSEIPALGTEKPEPEVSTDHPVHRLVLAEQLSHREFYFVLV